MINNIKAYFPENKEKWKIYLKVAIPIMLGSIMFALNSFVDNFMVGHVSGGLAGLFAANSWTGIMFSMYLGINVAGGILMGQYYFNGQKDKAMEIARLRTMLNIFCALVIAIPTWINPEMMIKVFLKLKNDATATEMVQYKASLDAGISYIRIITFAWILMAMTFSFGNIHREIGYEKWTLWAGMVGLSLNVILNSITIFILKMGTEGAAIATVTGRVGVFLILAFHIKYSKLPIDLNPLTQFKISNEILRQFFTRIFSVIFSAGTMIFITLRNTFYAQGFPTGSIDKVIGAASVLALTGALVNIFTTTFNAVGATASRFVGGELGKNNIEQAHKNAKELKGFLTTLAFFLALLLFAMTFALPYMTFLVGGKQLHSEVILRVAKVTLWPLALFYPWWIWFRTGTRVIMMGGKVNLVSIVDFLTAGPLQIGWLAIVMFVIVPATGMSFPMAYFVFFCSDIPRGIIFEILFYKMNWAHSITQEEEIADQMMGEMDGMEVEKETPVH